MEIHTRDIHIDFRKPDIVICQKEIRRKERNWRLDAEEPHYVILFLTFDGQLMTLYDDSLGERHKHAYISE